MTFTLGELADLVAGQLYGDADLEIDGADILRDVRAGQITLVAGDQLAEELARSPAAAAVVPAGFAPQGLPFIQVADLHGAFAKIVQLYRPAHGEHATGISPQAQVSDSAQIAAGATIFPGATIGARVVIGAGSVIHAGVRILPGCAIGEDVTIFPNVVLYENTVVGNRSVIHASAVIGSYGFGYHTANGRHLPTAQLGCVEIGDDVEIGAGTTIDRATYGSTTIGEGTKIDNLVQIAHNCHIGKHNLICAQVGIAGSCTTGDHVVMAGQVGVRDHIQIGNQVVLGAKSGAINDVPDGQVYLGAPATPQREQKLMQVALSKLPKLRREFKALVKRLELLERRSNRDAA